MTKTKQKIAKTSHRKSAESQAAFSKVTNHNNNANNKFYLNFMTTFSLLQCVQICLNVRYVILTDSNKYILGKTLQWMF